MKIVAVSDIHGYVEKLREVLVKENDATMIVFCGDIAPYRRHPETLNFLNKLSLVVNHFNIEYIIAVPGNVDCIEHYERIVEPRFVYLHGKCRRVKDVLFIGLGGSTKTPFNTILEYSEDEIHNILQSIYMNCVVQNKNISKDELYILVTHVPPYNSACDRIPSGDNIGSKSIRRFIEHTKPALALCGHVHESRCIDQVGTTIIVNPGPLAKGFYSTIYVDKGRIEANLGRL
ncbi:MAG: metallophosphoesterase [Ignisphaera sp.]|nr:metallophosphoesterase [Ignisphaera sp.]MCX8168166.1 metallophosphoesterase [Ignisphaera sp.]MDW8085194.1 metallophosphoesterase [Ignisphaera sp.]